MIHRFAHILIVDDDADVSNVICTVLEEIGYGVSTAKDAIEARSILETERIDLMVTDDVMFGEQGNILAEHASSLGIPALLISGHNDSIEKFEGGARLFLSKPFHLHELKNKVAEALGQPIGGPDES